MTPEILRWLAENKIYLNFKYGEKFPQCIYITMRKSHPDNKRYWEIVTVISEEQITKSSGEIINFQMRKMTIEMENVIKRCPE